MPWLHQAVRTRPTSRLLCCRWPPPPGAPRGRRWWATLRAAERLAGGHASLRSVWFVNSARGAFALAAAIAIADLANVQHGFWVVLGTVSVLRTNAASTGSTALRAFVGTAVGFFVGAGLILLIGDNTTALWAALPVAVMIAAYSPGTAPFAVGQAAFTVTISILYNILVPVGWHVGVVRLEDVAIGAGVSVVVGALFWPRGVAAVVAEDLADAYHDGGVYLVQATAWAVGNRDDRPDSARRAENAGIFAWMTPCAACWPSKAPSGCPKRTCGAWSAAACASGSPPSPSRMSPGRRPALTRPERALVQEAARLAGWCDAVAARLGHASATVARELRQLARGRQWGVGLDARLSALGPPPPRSLPPLSGRTGGADRRGRRPSHGSVVALISPGAVPGLVGQHGRAVYAVAHPKEKSRRRGLGLGAAGVRRGGLQHGSPAGVGVGTLPAPGGAPDLHTGIGGRARREIAREARTGGGFLPGRLAAHGRVRCLDFKPGSRRREQAPRRMVARGSHRASGSSCGPGTRDRKNSTGRHDDLSRFGERHSGLAGAGLGSRR